MKHAKRKPINAGQGSGEHNPRPIAGCAAPMQEALLRKCFGNRKPIVSTALIPEDAKGRLESAIMFGKHESAKRIAKEILVGESSLKWIAEPIAQDYIECAGRAAKTAGELGRDDMSWDARTYLVRAIAVARGFGLDGIEHKAIEAYYNIIVHGSAEGDGKGIPGGELPMKVQEKLRAHFAWVEDKDRVTSIELNAMDALGGEVHAQRRFEEMFPPLEPKGKDAKN